MVQVNVNGFVREYPEGTTWLEVAEEYQYQYEDVNRTYEYGVTFERGTAVTYGDRRHVFIAGTASIDR